MIELHMMAANVAVQGLPDGASRALRLHDPDSGITVVCQFDADGAALIHQAFGPGGITVAPAGALRDLKYKRPPAAGNGGPTQ